MIPFLAAITIHLVSPSLLHLAGAMFLSQQTVFTTCDSTPPAKVVLAVGDSVTRTIIGKNNPNRTGVTMARGAEYVFTARGSWQDGPNIPATDANGTPDNKLPTKARIFLFPFGPFRPVSNANWMALVGKIDAAGEKAFLIGTGPTKFTAAADGELTALANDVKHYSNNFGCLELTVRRVK